MHPHAIALSANMITRRMGIVSGWGEIGGAKSIDDEVEIKKKNHFLRKKYFFLRMFENEEAI